MTTQRTGLPAALDQFFAPLDHGRNLLPGGAEAGDGTTLRLDVPVFETIDELRWSGPLPSFEGLCQHLKSKTLSERAALCQRKLFQ